MPAPLHKRTEIPEIKVIIDLKLIDDLSFRLYTFFDKDLLFCTLVLDGEKKYLIILSLLSLSLVACCKFFCGGWGIAFLTHQYRMTPCVYF